MLVIAGAITVFIISILTDKVRICLFKLFNIDDFQHR